jgi:hypothetical protein
MAVYLCVATVFAGPANADSIAVAIEKFGLMGSWADDCAEAPGARHGFRMAVAAPSGSTPTYTTVNIDNGVKTTVHSLVLAAVQPSPRSLTLRVRIVGGDVDGGPLPSPTTNTFEQTFEKPAGEKPAGEKRDDSAMQMAGNPPIPLQRCRD